MVRSKNYYLVIQKIHHYIQVHHLKSGDRLPSERELSDQLGVGRSSVREALKALELLGIIATRRGEGTFIEERTSHKLFELIAHFIVLDQDHTQREIHEVRELLEAQALQLAGKRMSDEKLDELGAILRIVEQKVGLNQSPQEEIRSFYQILAKTSDNTIFYRIYLYVISFTEVFPHEMENTEQELVKLKRIYQQLQNLLITK